MQHAQGCLSCQLLRAVVHSAVVHAPVFIVLWPEDISLQLESTKTLPCLLLAPAILPSRLSCHAPPAICGRPAGL
jgi:hypothetical protein